MAARHRGVGGPGTSKDAGDVPTTRSSLSERVVLVSPFSGDAGHTHSPPVSSDTRCCSCWPPHPIASCAMLFLIATQCFFASHLLATYRAPGSHISFGTPLPPQHSVEARMAELGRLLCAQPAWPAKWMWRSARMQDDSLPAWVDWQAVPSKHPPPPAAPQVKFSSDRKRIRRWQREHPKPP